MADIAHPPRRVTVRYLSLADDSPVTPQAPLLLHRIDGQHSPPDELALTPQGGGVYTASYAWAIATHRLEGGSSAPADLCDPGEAEDVIPQPAFWTDP